MEHSVPYTSEEIKKLVAEHSRFKSALESAQAAMKCEIGYGMNPAFVIVKAALEGAK